NSLSGEASLLRDEERSGASELSENHEKYLAETLEDTDLLEELVKTTDPLRHKDLKPAYGADCRISQRVKAHQAGAIIRGFAANAALTLVTWGAGEIVAAARFSQGVRIAAAAGAGATDLYLTGKNIADLYNTSAQCKVLRAHAVGGVSLDSGGTAETEHAFNECRTSLRRSKLFAVLGTFGSALGTFRIAKSIGKIAKGTDEASLLASFNKAQADRKFSFVRDGETIEGTIVRDAHGKAVMNEGYFIVETTDGNKALNLASVAEQLHSQLGDLRTVSGAVQEAAKHVVLNPGVESEIASAAKQGRRVRIELADGTAHEGYIFSHDPDGDVLLSPGKIGSNDTFAGVRLKPGKLNTAKVEILPEPPAVAPPVAVGPKIHYRDPDFLAAIEAKEVELAVHGEGQALKNFAEGEEVLLTKNGKLVRGRVHHLPDGKVEIYAHGGPNSGDSELLQSSALPGKTKAISAKTNRAFAQTIAPDAKVALQVAGRERRPVRIFLADGTKEEGYIVGGIGEDGTVYLNAVDTDLRGTVLPIRVDGKKLQGARVEILPKEKPRDYGELTKNTPPALSFQEQMDASAKAQIERNRPEIARIKAEGRPLSEFQVGDEVRVAGDDGSIYQGVVRKNSAGNPEVVTQNPEFKIGKRVVSRGFDANARAELVTAPSNALLVSAHAEEKKIRVVLADGRVAEGYPIAVPKDGEPLLLNPEPPSKSGKKVQYEVVQPEDLKTAKIEPHLPPPPNTGRAVASEQHVATLNVAEIGVPKVDEAARQVLIQDSAEAHRHLAESLQEYLASRNVKSEIHCGRTSVKSCFVKVITPDGSLKGQGWLKRFARSLSEGRNGRNGFEFGFDTGLYSVKGAGIEKGGTILSGSYKDLILPHISPETRHELEHLLTRRATSDAEITGAATRALKEEIPASDSLVFLTPASGGKPEPHLVLAGTKDRIRVIDPQGDELVLSRKDYVERGLAGKIEQIGGKVGRRSGEIPAVIIKPSKYSFGEDAIGQGLNTQYAKDYLAEESQAYAQEVLAHKHLAAQLEKKAHALELRAAKATDPVERAQFNEAVATNRRIAKEAEDYALVKAPFADRFGEANKAIFGKIRNEIDYVRIKPIVGNSSFDTTVICSDGTELLLNSVQARPVGSSITGPLSKSELKAFLNDYEHRMQAMLDRIH
ncbi:MAG: hypothetical protein ACXVBW_09085, partial [Bdellovibrionota bacterium]